LTHTVYAERTTKNVSVSFDSNSC